MVYVAVLSADCMFQQCVSHIFNPSFSEDSMIHRSSNVDSQVVSDFGAEWSKFDQSGLSDAERAKLFSAYFAVFPWDRLPKAAVGMDVGCGSGRWAALVAPRVGRLLLVDPAASALGVAKSNLQAFSNVSFFNVGVDDLPAEDGQLDFCYSLGVLHHVPDTAAAMRSIARKLKVGAPFLVYLYYALDNRPIWFRLLWRLSDIVRSVISKLPRSIKGFMCDLIALAVYWPFARSASLSEKLGFNVNNWPLATYRNLSFYTMRTDALDRFGTRLEQRFTRAQIKTMLEDAGFERVVFHEGEPYWCAVALKKGAA